MKKLILFSAILTLISCNNSEKKQAEPVHGSEAVLIVNYQLDNMSLIEHAELGLQLPQVLFQKMFLVY